MSDHTQDPPLEQALDFNQDAPATLPTEAGYYHYRTARGVDTIVLLKLGHTGLWIYTCSDGYHSRPIEEATGTFGPRIPLPGEDES